MTWTIAIIVLVVFFVLSLALRRHSEADRKSVV